jgi:nitric oxide reductase large subunit
MPPAKLRLIVETRLFFLLAVVIVSNQLLLFISSCRVYVNPEDYYATEVLKLLFILVLFMPFHSPH